MQLEFNLANDTSDSQPVDRDTNEITSEPTGIAEQKSSSPDAKQSTVQEKVAVSEKTADRFTTYLLRHQELLKTTPEDKFPAAENGLKGQFVDLIEGERAARLPAAIFDFIADNPEITIQQLSALLDLGKPALRERLGSRSAVLDELHVRLPKLKGKWTSNQIQSTIRTIRDSEAQLSQLLNWQWLGPAKSSFDEQRYIIEMLFWHPNHISCEVFDSYLEAASNQYKQISALDNRLAKAYDAQNLATLRLPQMLNILESSQSKTTQWLTACDHAMALGEVLEAQMTTDFKTASSKIEDLASEMDPLLSLVDQLMAPYSETRLDELIGESKTRASDFGLMQQYFDVLQTPFVSSQARTKLNEVANQLSKKNHEKIMFEFSPSILNARTGLIGEELASSKTKASQRTKNRMRFAQGLLTIAGQNCTNTEGNLVASLRRVQTESSKPTMSLMAQERAQDALYSQDHHREKKQVRFARRRNVAVDIWEHRADLYSRLSRDSPLANVYHGMAQQYRLAAPGLRGAKIRSVTATEMVPSSSRSDKFHTTVRYIRGNLDARKRLAQVANFGGPSHNGTSSVSVAILEPRNKAMVIESVLHPQRNEVTIDVKKSKFANPDSQLQDHGFFVNLAEHGYHLLHRVDLPSTRSGEIVKLFFAKDEDTKRQFNTVRLRPTGKRHPLGLFVQNTCDQSLELSLQLHDSQTELKLLPYETKKATFPGKPPKPTEDLPELTDGIEVIVTDSKSGRKLLRKEFTVTIASPKEFIEVVESRFIPFAGGRNRLEVSLRSIESFTGPDCMAKLDFDPHEFPGGLKIGGGRLQGPIPKDGSLLTLYAENIVFNNFNGQSGIFHISVDGVPRTFVFKSTFPTQGNPVVPERLIQPSITMEAPRYGLAGPELPVILKTKNAPADASIQLQLAKLDAQNDADFQIQLPSPYQTKIGFSPLGQDGMIFTAEVNDWKLNIDASNLVGRRVLKSTLMNKTSSIARCEHPISLDDRPPRSVRFVDFDRRQPGSRTKWIKASALSELTGINEISVFFGAPENGEVPENAELIRLELANASQNIWASPLEFPSKLGKQKITAVATNKAGLSTFETTQVLVVDPDTFNSGTILGQVFEGVRKQPNLPVVLIDQEGNPIAETKTEFDGTFIFEAVPSGDYTVKSVKKTTGRTGANRVKVESGQKKVIEISLRM